MQGYETADCNGVRGSDDEFEGQNERQRFDDDGACSDDSLEMFRKEVQILLAKGFLGFQCKGLRRC